MDNKKNNNILFIGPITDLHGQGRVTKQTLKILTSFNNVKLINTNIKNSILISKILKSVLILFLISTNLIKNIFKNKYNIIYFTPSRNIGSSIKDTLLLTLLYLINFKQEKINIIAHLHGADLKNLIQKGIYGKLLGNLYLVNEVHMILNSKAHSKYALGNKLKNYHFINNPINLENIPHLRINAKKEYIEGHIKICFISIPSEGKGLLRSIIWCEETFKLNNWKLDVVGWSLKDFEEIYQQKNILNSNQKKRIIFHGRVSDSEKENILLRSHLFILLSFSEAQPLSVIEAGIFKCGIILSDIDMLSEFKIFKSILINNKKIDQIQVIKMLKNKIQLDKTSEEFINRHSLNHYEKNLKNVLYGYKKN